MSSWRTPVLSIMRVPPMPAPPPGSQPRIFRAAGSFYALKVIRFVVVQTFAAFGAVVGTFAIFYGMRRGDVPPEIASWVRVVEIVVWSFFVLQFLFGLAVVRLDWELRWYMLSDRAVRVREGITTVREKTITLANIQNISIKQGPLQRIFGIADVEVRTAGGGGGSGNPHQKSTEEPGHVAYFRGVANPEEIRTLLIEGVRRQRDSGLGDTDDHPAEPAHDDTLEAARAVLEEARALRAAVS